MSPSNEISTEKDPPIRVNIPLKGEAAFRDRFAKMAAPLQQKVGAIAVYLPTRGVVVDVGCADGPITEKLAELCPDLTFIGIDNEPCAINSASERDFRDNLSFRLADASEPIFERSSIDGIVFCSTAHELASFMKGGVGGLWKVLDHSADALKVGGRLVIRDFVSPHNGLDEVALVVSSVDGESEGDTETLSTGAMLRKFLTEFRSSFYPDGKIPYSGLIDSDKLTAVRIGLRDAAEFALKKDYRKNWDHEVTEQFLHFTQETIVSEFLRRGLRILLASEIHNPWIRENSFNDKIKFLGPNGEKLPFPPTNFIISGEKTERGILLSESAQNPKPAPEWNTIRFYKDFRSGAIWELARRQHDRVHMLPWYVDGTGGIQVFVCDSYPRPIVNSKSDSPSLDRSFTSGYLMELPYEVISNKKDLLKECDAFLKKRNFRVLGAGAQRSHLTSPVDLSDELVMISFEIEAPDDINNDMAGSESGWSESGKLRAFPAQQILRSAQMGAVSEPEIERAVYRLLVDQRMPVGPWIGAGINIDEGEVGFPISTELFSSSLRPSRPYDPINDELSPKYQSVVEGTFSELDREGKVLRERQLEYIHPRELSNNKILVVPLRRGKDGRIHVGLERRALPSLQETYGDANTFSLPEYRLPKEITELEDGCDWVMNRIKEEFSLSSDKFVPLGGKYWSSPAISPEVTYPFAVEVWGPTGNLFWIPLEEVVGCHSLIRNGHTLTGVFRAAHATGVLDGFLSNTA